MLDNRSFSKVKKALAVALVSGMCFTTFQTPTVAASRMNAPKIEKIVGKDGKVGFKFSKDLVISARYDAVSDFKNGLAFVQKNKAWGMINTSGVEVVRVTNQLKDGANVDDASVYKFTEGFISYTNKEGMMGFINTLGRKTIPAKYAVVRDFHNGYAIVGKYIERVDAKTKKKVTDLKFSAINRWGREITKFVYDGFENFSGRLAIVTRGNKVGRVNAYGKEVIPAVYDDLTNYSSGLIIAEKNGKLGLINGYGRAVLGFEYDAFYGFGAGLGTYTTKMNDKEVVMNKAPNLAKVSKNGKVGLINKMGKIVLKPSYKDISEFGKNFAVVTKKAPKTDRVGLINKMGRLVVEPIYDKFENLNGTYVKVWDQKRVGLVNAMGKIVVRPIYDSVTSFKGNFAKITKDGKFGLINRAGMEVVAPQYDTLKDLVDGYMEYTKGKETGYLNAQGKVVK